MARACWFGAGIRCPRTKVSENCYVSTTEKTIFRGYGSTTEPHRTARKQGYMYSPYPTGRNLNYLN